LKNAGYTRGNRGGNTTKAVGWKTAQQSLGRGYCGERGGGGRKKRPLTWAGGDKFISRGESLGI